VEGKPSPSQDAFSTVNSWNDHKQHGMTHKTNDVISTGAQVVEKFGSRPQPPKGDAVL
jgi:hypothetical protein